MKFLKSKLFFGIVCFIMAIAVGFVGVPLVNNITNEKVSVVRFKENVGKGSLIEAQSIEVVQISPNGLPIDVITDPKDVVNNYAVADAQSGDYVTMKRLSPQRPSANSYLYDLPKGKLAVSFSVGTFATGLSGKVEAGDIVSLYTVVGDKQNVEKSEQIAAEASPALSYIKVLAATSAEGTDTDGEKQDADGRIILPATITVLANAQQAKLIAGLEQNGKIQLALATRGDDAYAEELLHIQEDYFTQLKEQELLNPQETPVAPEVPTIPQPPVETITPPEGEKNNAK